MSVFRRPAPASPTTNGHAHPRARPPSARLPNSPLPPLNPRSAQRGEFPLSAAPRSLPYNAPRSITASAQQINLRRDQDVEDLKKRLSNSDNWQGQAWDYYDAVGEVKFGFSVVANLMSRIRMYAGFIPSHGAVPLEADPTTVGGQVATQALSKLSSAYGGQETLVRTASLNFLVAGECYLVQTPLMQGPDGNLRESWDIKSIDEVVVDTSHAVRLRSERRQNPSDYSRPLPKSAYVGRLWRRHPRFSNDADSSMIALLELCAELLLLNRTYRATERSRLNAGALYLPDGLSVAANPDAYPGDDGDGDGDEGGLDPALFAAPERPDDDEDAFEDALVEAMTTPIADESSASSIVPLIIRGPAELGDKIKQFKFERAFDSALTVRYDRVLDRIMQGIDVPKDIVTGLANVKYANAVQINDNLYKAHIEPLALLLCDCLTTAFLRPAMQAMGVSEEEAQRYCVWYDPTQVTAKPNKAEDADNGYDRHLLAGAAWRTAHGFTDDDSPSPEEIAVRLLVEKGSFTPELTEALLAVVAPDVMANVRAASQADNPAPLPPEVANALTGEPPAAPTDEATAPEPAAEPPPAPAQPLPGVIDERSLV